MSDASLRGEVATIWRERLREARRAAYLECAEIAEREAEQFRKLLGQGSLFGRVAFDKLSEIAARYRQMAEESGG